METPIRTTIVALSPSDYMTVSYCMTDMPNTLQSGMYNLLVRSALNEVPPLEQAVPGHILDNPESQERLAQELVRAYLIAINKIPNADISFQLNDETIAGNLAGSEIWWTFYSGSPAFLRHFPSGMVRVNTLFIDPLSPEMETIMVQLSEGAASLTWRRQ
jgi:hypothetical protein